jgi:hypothetical protein
LAKQVFLPVDLFVNGKQQMSSSTSLSPRKEALTTTALATAPGRPPIQPKTTIHDGINTSSGTITAGSCGNNDVPPLDHDHPSLERPPKPKGIPFASVAAAAPMNDCSGNSHTTTSQSHNHRHHDVSAEGSRASLRESVNRRRNSLTLSEREFLDELLVNGNEFEVQVAHENLLDNTLFPEFVTTTTHEDNLSHSETTTGGGGWTQQDGFIVGKERDSLSVRSTSALDDMKHHQFVITNMPEQHMDDSSNNHHHRHPIMHASASITGGSERRLQILQDRRRSTIATNLWKAHENGIALSSIHNSVTRRKREFWKQMMMSTARTPKRRGSSARVTSAGGAAKQQQQQQTTSIFRMEDIKSDNYRRPRSATTTTKSATSPTRHKQQHLPLPHHPPSMPAATQQRQLHRMLSDGSRKSVTFKEHTTTTTAATAAPKSSSSTTNVPPFHLDDSLSSIHSSSLPSLPAHPRMQQHHHPPGSSTSAFLRLASVSSIPSLHHGHSVHSESSSTPYPRSVSSFPSLHHGHSVFSDTNSDITETEPPGYLDDDEVEEYDAEAVRAIHPRYTSGGGDGGFEEKKSNWGEIPSKVVISSPAKPDRKTDLSIHPKATTTTTHTTLLLQHKDDSMDSQQVPTRILFRDDENAMDDTEFIIPEPPSTTHKRHVLTREASMNTYDGEGIEIVPSASIDDNNDSNIANSSNEMNESFFMETTEDEIRNPIAAATTSLGESLLTFGNGDGMSLRSCNSFDESRSYGRISSIFRRVIRRTLSEDSGLGTGIVPGDGKLLLPNHANHSNTESSTVRDMYDDESSWMRMDDDTSGYFDSWKVIEDEYENGYGGGGTLSFRILGTSADDVDSHPHVLSPPLMESLQQFFPISKANENFWMKYSLVRDGASLHTFLQYARGSKYTVLAIETTDGEVFGAFTSEAWRKNWNYFGSGESFLWKMRRKRTEKCHSIIDQAQMESEIDVYPYTGSNNSIQLCTHDRIAVGGGSRDSTSSSSPNSSRRGKLVSQPIIPLVSKINTNVTESSHPPKKMEDRYKDHEWSFGITLESDLLQGTTSPCLTFGSPSLSTEHSDGSHFEVINVELWTLTPCLRLEEAEKLELGRLFLEKHSGGQ